MTLSGSEMARTSKKSASERLGASPKQISKELRVFSRAARLLSSNRPRLIAKHPNEWVGLYKGTVCASDSSFDGLMEKLKSQGVPPKDAIIRYIDTSGRKLIL